FTAGANIVFTADAVIDPPIDDDFEGELATVEFFANGESIGFANTGDGTIFGLQWWNAPAGRFEITAEVTDFRGLQTLSEPIDIVVLESDTLSCPVPVEWQASAGGRGYDTFGQ